MGEQNKTLSLRASKAPDGRARIVASVDDRELWAGVCDLWSDTDRDRLAEAIHQDCPAIPVADIRRRLLVIDRENLPAGDGSSESAWDDPDPLPDPLPSVMAYSADLLPREVGDVVDDIADRMQCPPDFPAASMLVALAAVIGCRVGIRPRRFDDWLVVPNLWGCVVGRPSLKKSPAIGHAEKRIRALEAREREKIADDVAAFGVDAILCEADIKAAKKAIEKAVNADNREEARRLALEIQAMEEASPPTPRRIITTDSTIEKLGEMLNKYPHGMLLWVDELVGWMRGLDRHDMAGVRQQFLTLWNGQGRLNIDRVGRGETVVEHPCLSVFGCATPGGIGDYVAAALRGGRGDDGLIQRLQVLVWPDSPREYRQVDRWPNSVARDRLVSVFESLADLDVESFAEREEFDDGSGIPWVRFDADAQSVFDRWDVETQNRIRAGDLPESFESHLSKYASLIPSIALIVHLVKWRRGPVDAMSVEMALKWAEYLESHAARLYSIAMAPERRLAKQLLRKLIAWPETKPIRVRDIVRHCWSGLDDEEVVAQGLEMLADAGWVRAVAVRPESGRPTTNYLLHPRAAQFFETLKTRTDKTDETRPEESSVSFDSADLGGIEKNGIPEPSGGRVRGVI